MSERVAVVESQVSDAEETTQINHEIDSGNVVDHTSSGEHAKYMYVRENGVIEKANDSEEIARRCPALGKLAIEAPDQFDAMLALSEMTSQRMVAESKPQAVKAESDTKKEAPVKRELTNKQSSKKTISPEDTVENATPKPTVQPEQSIAQTQDAKKYVVADLDVGLQQSGPETIENDTVKPQTFTETELRQQATDVEDRATVDNLHIIEEVVSTSEPNASSGDTTESFAVSPNKQIEDLKPEAVQQKVEPEAPTRREAKTSTVEISEQVPYQQTEQLTPTTTTESLRNTESLAEQASIAEQPDSHSLEPAQAKSSERVPSSEISFEDSFPDDLDGDTKDGFADEFLTGNVLEEMSTESLFMEDSKIDDSPFPVDSYDLLDDARELLFGGEIMESATQVEDDYNLEVFDEMLDEEMQDIHDTLLEIISMQEVDTFETQVIVEDDIAPTTAEETEHANPEQSPFEKYLEQTDVIPEETLTYEAVTEHTDSKPVEETLVELVQMFSNPEEPPEELAPGALIEILEDIEQVLNRYYYHEDKKTIIAQPELTPALTKQLVLLLGELGYLEPKEALVKMIQQYNLTFLLEALSHLCRLKNQDERQEFLIQSKTYVDQQDDARTRKVSKLIALVLARVLRPGFSGNEA